ncbi:MAG: co-chaperone GroES [Bdellovibrionaceae bacterium]|nr:co-chaperone GroES [Pseudobdellovibrionaceae bacterium]
MKSKKASAKKAAPKKVAAQKKSSKSAPKKAVKTSAPKKASSAKKPVLKAKRPLGRAPSKKTTSVVSAQVSLKDLSNFVTPLDDRIIVRLTAADRKTPGGLFIPDTVADVSGNLEGLVMAVGRGHRGPKGRIRPMDVVAGDRVLFSEYSGSKIRLKDEDFVILREGDVAGVLS